MKRNHYFSFIAILAMLFASCSKEEDAAPAQDDMATLSFGAIVQDLADKSTDKQSSTGIPQCSDDTPAYVEIILSQAGDPVVGELNDPFRVDLVAGQVFTEEVPELELEPGDYTLDHFMVYNSEGDLLWIAPKGGVFADWVDHPLPLNISLGAGVKKYVDVSVLCYDDRDVIEYGYLFFEFDMTEAIEFCVFGNFCDETGRHYPARFSIDVWMWDGDSRGVQIHDNVTNTVAVNNDGDYAGTPACVPLPDTDADEEYYFEITLLDSEAYGNVQERIIRSGVITDDEVKNLFDGDDNLDYYHFREGEGCENEDNPPIFGEPGDDAQVYKACLTPLNESGAYAFAYFRLDGNILQSTVLATNMEPNVAHPQHIHGLDVANATCPPESASGDDDLITLEEGLPYYGGVVLALRTEGGDFPVANSSGNYIYERTFTLGAGGVPSVATLGDLEDRAVVLHGLDIDGTYQATLPVACAEITQQE